MSKADLLLELLIISFDPPSQFGLVDEIGELSIFRQGREPVLSRLDLAVRPLDQELFLSSWRGAPVIAVRRPDADGGKARGERRLGALAPGDAAPGVLGQRFRGLLGGNRRVPGLSRDERGRATASAPRLRRQRLCVRRPQADRGLDGDDIGQANLRQPGAERGVVAVTGIGQHHAPRDAGLQRRPNLREGDFGLGAEDDILRHTCLGPPVGILGPAFRQIELLGDRQARLAGGNR